jgi:hypothetical protein
MNKTFHKAKEYRTHVKAHSEGEVREVETTRFSQVNTSGEGPLSGKGLKVVNRRDTPKQVTTGTPVVLNRGETIFTPRIGRPVDEGRTIRCEEDCNT